MSLFNAYIEAYKRGDHSAFFTFIDPVTGEAKVHKKAVEFIKRLQSHSTFDDAYGGAAGGAKSFCIVYWQIMNRICYPDTRGFIARTELKLLRQFTTATFKKVFTKLEVNPEKYKFNAQDNCWIFDNGSQIDYIDCNTDTADAEYERFGSYEATDGCFEECGAIKYKAVDVLRSRTNRQNNDKYNLPNKRAYTFNPTKTWIYKEFYKPYKEKKLPPKVSFLPCLAVDNPFAQKGYIENLENLKDKTMRERLLHGNFEYDDNSLKLYDYDCIINCFSNFIEYSENKMRITADIARFGKDKTIICVWRDWDLIYIKIIKSSDLKAVCSEIEAMREKYKVSKSDVCVDSDGLGAGVEDFGGYKGFVANSRPIDERSTDEKEKQPINYQNLKAQCAYLLQTIINENKMRISAELDADDKQAIIDELDSYEAYKVDSDIKKAILPKAKQKEKLGCSPDFGDAIIMRYYFELKQNYNLVAFI